MKKIVTSLRAISVFAVLCGIIYPLAITGFSLLFFQDKANGSMITIENAEGKSKVVGSKWIGQTFTDPVNLIGRPQKTSYLAPNSEEQTALVKERVQFWHDVDPTSQTDIPMELVTASASGADPFISPEAAAYQVTRITKERGIDSQQVKDIIDQYTTKRSFYLFGEPVVNVLEVNIALDKLSINK